MYPTYLSFFFSFANKTVTYFVFFFQAEDGIRDADVTGVQTCALPISSDERLSPRSDDHCGRVGGVYRRPPANPGQVWRAHGGADRAEDDRGQHTGRHRCLTRIHKWDAGVIHSHVDDPAAAHIHEKAPRS